MLSSSKFVDSLKKKFVLEIVMIRKSLSQTRVERSFLRHLRKTYSIEYPRITYPRNVCAGRAFPG